MDPGYDEKMVAIAVACDWYCPKCESKIPPRIDDMFIVCGGCGRIKHRVFEHPRKRKRTPPVTPPNASPGERS